MSARRTLTLVARDSAGALQPGTVVRITPIDPITRQDVLDSAPDGSIVSAVEGVTDAAGYLAAALWPTARLVRGSWYRVALIAPDRTRRDVVILMPDSATTLGDALAATPQDPARPTPMPVTGLSGELASIAIPPGTALPALNDVSVTVTNMGAALGIVQTESVLALPASPPPGATGLVWQLLAVDESQDAAAAVPWWPGQVASARLYAPANTLVLAFAVSNAEWRLTEVTKSGWLETAPSRRLVLRATGLFDARGHLEPGGAGVGVQSWLQLQDTPAHWGAAGTVPRVNTDRDGLEFWVPEIQGAPGRVLAATQDIPAGTAGITPSGLTFTPAAASVGIDENPDFAGAVRLGKRRAPGIIGTMVEIRTADGETVLDANFASRGPLEGLTNERVYLAPGVDASSARGYMQLRAYSVGVYDDIYPLFTKEASWGASMPALKLYLWAVFAGQGPRGEPGGGGVEFGSALPATPERGDLFVRTGAVMPGLYVCVTNGVWSSVRSFTAADAAKLATIETGAEVNVAPDWNATSGDGAIRNKPFVPVVDHELGRFEFPSSGNPNALARQQLVFVNQLNASQRRIYLRPSAGTDGYVGAHWQVGFQLDVGGAVIELATHTLPPVKESDGTYAAHYTLVSGALPAQGATGIVVRVRGDVPFEGDLAAVALSGAAADVSVSASGFSGYLGATDTTVQDVAAALDTLDVSPVLDDWLARDTFTTAFSSHPPSAGEVVLYGAGTPSAETDIPQNADLSTVRTIRFGLDQAPPGQSPNSPHTNVRAVSLRTLAHVVERTLGGVALAFVPLPGPPSTPRLSRLATAYSVNVSSGVDTTSQPGDSLPYLELSDMIWAPEPPPPRTPDNGSVATICALAALRSTGYGLVFGRPLGMSLAEATAGTVDLQRTINAKTFRSAVLAIAPSGGGGGGSVDTEAIRIAEFIDDPATVALTDYDIVDSISGVNPTGKIDLTEGTGLNPPISVSVTAQGKTAGAIGHHRDALMSIEVGDQFLVANTDDTEYVFGTITTIAYEDGSGNTVSALPASNGQANFDYTLDADRGLDAYSQLGAGAGAFYFRRAPLARDLGNLEVTARGSNAAPDSLLVRVGTAVRTWSWANALARLNTTLLKRDGSNLNVTARGSNAAPDSLLVRVGTVLHTWTWANAFARIKAALLGDHAFLDGTESPSDPFMFGSAYTYRGRDSENKPVNADGQWGLNAAPVLDGVAVGITIQFKEADATEGIRRWKTANEFLFGTARFRITGSVNQIHGRRYQATVQLVAGAEPAEDATATPALEPDTPHRSELTTASYKSRVGTIAHYYLRTTGGGSGVGDVVSESPLTALPTDSNERKMLMTAGTIATQLKASKPQSILAVNANTVAATNAYAVLATTGTITPRSSSSKFWIRVDCIIGSINLGSATGARMDCQIERKIGTGAWTVVLAKNYTGFFNFGNPPAALGPVEDAPATTSPVSYRGAIRKIGTGTHRGAWNSERFTVSVIERL